MVAGAVCTQVSACSFLFGDTFHDRANDYLSTREYEQIQIAEGMEELEFRDQYAIPELLSEPAFPESFETPRALLFVEEADEDNITTLREYRSDILNPQLDKDGAGTLILRLGSSYAASWEAVTQAINISELKMTDLNRSTGTYYLELDNPNLEDTRSWWDKLWGEEFVTTSTYLLKMSRSRHGVYLSLLTDADNLADTELTERVLSEIQNKLAS